MNLELDDPAIDSPKRTKILIDAAMTIGYDLADLPNLVLEALDAPAPTSLFPIYDNSPDLHPSESPAFLMMLINTLSGSDDDHDDLVHDLDHALSSTQPCEDHPHIPCARCCDLCDE